MRILKKDLTAKDTKNCQKARREKSVFAIAFLCGLCACFVISVVTIFAGLPDKDDGAKYLQNVAEKFAKITDYTVDVKVHPELENVKAHDMTAKLYYKSPDKVKIDSKSIFILPKEVGAFNPRMFNTDNFDVSVEGDLQYDGKPAVKLSLSPKKDSFRDRRIFLIVDETEWLIREISTEPTPGGVMDAKINYGNFRGFELPTEIAVNINLPKADSTSQDNMNQRRRFGGGINGRITIYYSNYKVNSGLSDSLFEKSNGSYDEMRH